MLAIKRIDFVAQAAGRFSDTKLQPPSDWMPVLRELMKGYQKAGAIRSLDALFVRLCDGDAEAVLMLRHVLDWQPHAKRADGAIWRSAKDWMPYTGLTPSQVYNEKRRERLRKAGLKVWVERAMGENTLHFLVDAARFTANISAALGLNYNHAMLKLWEIVPVEVRQVIPPISFPQARVANGKARVSNDEIPLTESTTKESTDKTTLVGGLQNDFSGNESFALLNRERLGAAEKEKYAVLPSATVQACIDDANLAKSLNKIRKSRLAYLRGCLANALKELDTPTASPSAFSAAQGDSTPPPIPNPSPAISGTIPTAEVPKSVAVDKPPAWWSCAMFSLELRMGRNEWPYLKQMVYADCSGNLVTIAIPSTLLRMVQRYQRNIERAISDTRFEATKVTFAERTT